MIEVGQVINLNNKKFAVINKIKLHNINCVYLMSIKRPLEIIIATEKYEDDKLVLKEITDNNELDYVLSQLILDSNSEEN